MKTIYYFTPILNFFIAALFGLLLRALFVFPINGVTYLYLLHTHSHIALLGWLYLLVYVLFVQVFSIKNEKEEKFYTRLFWTTQLAVVGMMVTFPFQGYAAPSIAFSTLHILCSYAFVYRLWKNNSTKTNQEKILLKTSLFFMLFSTIGVWCLGPAVGMMGKASAFYQICIQFFLHFQFDGWFMTAFLALLFSFLFKEREMKLFRMFYWTWCTSVVLTYSLPLSWYVEYSFLHIINAIGVIIQLVAFGLLVKPCLDYWKDSNNQKKRPLQFLLLLAGVCFLLRIVVQFSAVYEGLAEGLKGLRSWIVAFIHLNMLGILTGFGLWLLVQSKRLKVNILSKVGSYLLVIAFLGTESILFLQGYQGLVATVFIDNTMSLMFWISVLFPISIGCLLLSFVLKNKNYE